MCGTIFVETPRLVIKTPDMRDFAALRMLQKDDRVMEFFDAPRSELRIASNIFKIQNHFRRHGFAQGAVFDKETREFVGRAGFTVLDFREPSKGEKAKVELGCFFFEEHWKKGYATEIAGALIQHAFELGFEEVYATIDPTHTASMRAAEGLGMTFKSEYTYDTHKKQVRLYVIHNPLFRSKL